MIVEFIRMYTSHLAINKSAFFVWQRCDLRQLYS